MFAFKKPFWGLVLLIALAIGTPAGASTFARVDLDDLVAENGLIVVGEVLSTRSYWNDPGTLILTDVQVAVSEVLKGKLADHEITVTLPGGTVGDDTISVIGGAELIPGNAYVLFLQKGDLPGASGALVVRDHSQGVFEIRMDKDGLRAVSQAVRLNLVPDALGRALPPGGAQGMPFQAVRQSILDLAPRGGRREVQ
jgi:hypothetical protein